MFAWSVHIKGDRRIYGLEGKEVAWAGDPKQGGLVSPGLQSVELDSTAGRWLRPSGPERRPEESWALLGCL